MLKTLINRIFKQRKPRRVSPLGQFGDIDLKPHTVKEQRLEHSPLLYWAATLIDENSHLIGIARSLVATDVPHMVGQPTRGVDIFISARYRSTGIDIPPFRAAWMTARNGNIELYFSEYHYGKLGNHGPVFSISAADPNADTQLLKMLLDVRLSYADEKGTGDPKFPFLHDTIPKELLCSSKTV